MDFQTCSLTVVLKTFCSIKSSWADSLISWLIYRNVSDTNCVFIIRVLISLPSCWRQSWSMKCWWIWTTRYGCQPANIWLNFIAMKAVKIHNILLCYCICRYWPLPHLYAAAVPLLVIAYFLNGEEGNCPVCLLLKSLV